MKKMLAAALSAALLLGGCASEGNGNGNESTGGTESSTESGGDSSGSLNIFTWADYIPGAVIDAFEAETGIEVNYATFSTNEEMLSKLQAQGGVYDIIVCSDYIIDVMIGEGGLIQELDTSRLSNFVNIDPAFQNQYYDPYNKYTIPHAAAAALLVYDPLKTGREITGYNDLWDSAYKDSLVVLNGGRDVIGFTLQSLGYSVNETDAGCLAETKARLLELKPNIHSFNADTPHEAIIQGDAYIGYMFGSQVTAAMEAVEGLEYAYPEEGMGIYIDSYVMADNAPNEENAYRFLNYILDGEVSAEISSIINYINCNAAAQAHLPQSFLDNAAVNIPSEVLAKAEPYEDLGDAAISFDEIWTEFKSQ